MRRTVFAVLALALVLPLTAQAQHWTDEETEVWDTIRALWEKWNAMDLQGSMEYFHPDALGWGGSTPIPIDKASVERSTRFDMEQPDSQTLFWEIEPAGIRIIDNAAVAYYFYRRVFIDAEHKRQTTRTRYTEVLQKSGDRWVWIGWYSHELKEN